MEKKKLRERFGILVRPTDRWELIQLGTEGGGTSLRAALEAYFGGAIRVERTSDGYAYVSRVGAFEDGCPKNDPMSYQGMISMYGDVIMLPKTHVKHGGCAPEFWSIAEANQMKVLNEAQWRNALRNGWAAYHGCAEQ